jgi:hypothetical protein
MIKTFFKRVDIFPENFSLSVNGEGPKKSLAGGIMTILSILSSLIVTIILVNDFVFNRKITLISQVQYDPNMRPLNIFPSDLQFGFSIWDSFSFKIQSRPFIYNHVVQVDLDWIKIISNNYNPQSLRVNQGKFVPCTANHTSKDFIPYMEKFQLFNFNFSNIYCINLDNMTSDHLETGGNLMYTFRQEMIHFYFEVDSCKLDPVNCKNTTAMNEKGYQMTLQFKDNYFNVMEPKGYTPFMNTYIFPFIFGKNTDLYMSLVKNELVSDNALLLKNEETDYFYSYDNIKQISNDKVQTFYAQNVGETISTLNVIIETPIRFQKFNRTYSKIDTLFASINALIALSFMIGRTISMLINLGKVDHYIMKKLYFFDEKEEDILLKIKPKKISIKQMKNKITEYPEVLTDINLITLKNNFKNHQTENDPDEEEDKDNPFLYLIEKKSLTRNWISSGLYAIGLSNCIKLTRPNILYKHGKLMLKYDLNALNMIKKLIYFESLLKVLFNKDQLNILKNIRSRYVNVFGNFDDHLNKVKEIIEEIKDKKEIIKINKSLKKCLNDKNPISKKLIELL